MTEPVGSTHSFIEGVGRAAQCDAAPHHTPKPLRFVWHHILPQVCGGKSVVTNLVQVCDDCHYAIHDLLYDLAQHGGQLAQHRSLMHSGRYTYALQGYNAAVSNGTVGSIPNQGGGAE